MIKAYEPTGKILFEEVQRFPKWLLLLIAAICLSSLLLTVGATLGTSKGDEDRQVLWIVMPVIIVIEAVMLYLFFVIRFEKVVTSNGFYFRWLPLQKKYRVIEKEEIVKTEWKKAPVSYGSGWDLNYGRVHNLSKGEGLQLYTGKGKKIFFGTNDKPLLQKAIEEMLFINRKSHLSEF